MAGPAAAAAAPGAQFAMAGMEILKALLQTAGTPPPYFPPNFGKEKRSTAIQQPQDNSSLDAALLGGLLRLPSIRGLIDSAPSGPKPIKQTTSDPILAAYLRGGFDVYT